MNKTFLLIALAAMLTGCAVVPYDSRRGQGQVVVEPEVRVSVVYIWDPYMSQYYFIDRGRKTYMVRGWVHPGQGRRHDDYHDNGHKHKHKDRD